jgi:hypothetical protein
MKTNVLFHHYDEGGKKMEIIRTTLNRRSQCGGSCIIDTERLREIDKKIKRYEGIDALLSHILHEKDKDATNWKETDDVAPQSLNVNENEPG